MSNNKEKQINPKAAQFIDESDTPQNPSGVIPVNQAMHPDAHQFIDDSDDTSGWSQMSDQNAPETSTLEAVEGGLANGASLGFANRMGAGLGAGAAYMGERALSDKKHQHSLADLYNEYLKQANRSKELYEMEHPVAYHGSEFAGAMMLPLGEGAAAKNASMLSKMGKGAKAGMILGGINGLAQSQDLTNPGQDAVNTAIGATVGGLVGATVPPVVEGAKTLASGAKEIGTQVLGNLGDAFQTGRYNGQNDLPNLAMESGRKQAAQMRGEFASDVLPEVVKRLNDLGKLKNTLINEAAEKGVRIDPTQIDQMIQEAMANDPKTNLTEVADEMHQFRELLKTAKEGPEVQQVIRKFFAEGNSAKEKFLQKAALTDAVSAASQAPEAVPGSMVPTSTPLDLEPDTGSQFSGFKKILSRRINPEEVLNQAEIDAAKEAGELEPEPITAAEKFAQDVEAKKAEMRALPGAHDPNLEGIQIHHEPIEGSDEVMAVARQPVVDESPTAFTPGPQPRPPGPTLGPSEVLFQESTIPGKKFAIQRQPIIDPSGKITGYKVLNKQLVPEAEAAKFQDQVQTVRTGDRDLSDPRELLRLYQDLKEKSKFGNRPYSSNDAQRAVGDAIGNVQNLLRTGNLSGEGQQGIPGLQAADDKIAALKRVADLFNIDTRNLDEEQATKKILDLIGKQSSNNTPGIMANRQFDSMISEIEKVDPAWAQQLKSEIERQSLNKDVLTDIEKPFNQLSVTKPIGIVRTFGTRLAHGTGYKVGQAQQAMSEGIQKASTYMDKYTPQVIQKAADAAMTSADSGIQQLSSVLRKSATLDERSRNAVIWGVMQNPAYRQWMEKNVGIESPVGQVPESIKRSSETDYGQ